ncbi:unnamed protein product [Mytilus edulis]|uniref:Uncharacterized protein n=1 Tax=Mytilus edulis TaxID=6550 RepID=A0A8S3T8Y7_MYTED|nr:unnamed protein product [Mytilus edulis]
MPSCFCYHIKCFDDNVYTKAPVLYIMQKPREDVAQVFVECLEKENQGHLHLKLSYEAYGLDERGQENHQEATQSWLCDCSLAGKQAYQREEAGQERTSDTHTGLPCAGVPNLHSYPGTVTTMVSTAPGSTPDCERYMADKIVYTGNVWDYAKAHLLAIINGTEWEAGQGYTEGSEMVSGLRHITDYIVKLQPYLYEQAKNSKECKGTDYNIDGSTVNYVICSLKNKALTVAFDYLTEQDIEVETLVIDGIVLYKDNVPPKLFSWVLAVCS